MDSGYSWVVLIASFCNYGIIFGSACSFGVYFVVLIDYFQCERAEAALVAALGLSMIALSGPGGDMMFRKYGARITVMTGGFIATIGHIANYFAGSISQLAISYAIVGFGMGLGVISSLVILPQYFDKYNNIVIAFVPIGASVGLFIFPPIFFTIIQRFTWRGSMLINAGIMLHIVVCGALMRPAKSINVSTTNSAGGSRSNICTALRKSCSIFAQLKMLLFCITAVGWAGSSSIFYPMINDLAVKNTGLTTGETTAIMIVCGVCDLSGRILASVVVQFKRINREMTYTLALLIFGVAILASTFGTTLMHFYITAGVFGFGFGFTISIFGIVAADLFGYDEMSKVLGFGNLFAGTGALVVPIIGGMLADKFDQRFAFYFGGGTGLVLGAFCALLLFLFTCRTHKAQEKILSEDDDIEEIETPLSEVTE